VRYKAYLRCASNCLKKGDGKSKMNLLRHRPLEMQGTELVAAGFPCTDVSRAGLRKGLQGKVSHV